METLNMLCDTCTIYCNKKKLLEHLEHHCHQRIVFISKKLFCVRCGAGALCCRSEFTFSDACTRSAAINKSWFSRYGNARSATIIRHRIRCSIVRGVRDKVNEVICNNNNVRWTDWHPADSRTTDPKGIHPEKNEKLKLIIVRPALFTFLRPFDCRRSTADALWICECELRVWVMWVRVCVCWWPFFCCISFHLKWLLIFLSILKQNINKVGRTQALLHSLVHNNVLLINFDVKYERNAGIIGAQTWHTRR